MDSAGGRGLPNGALRGEVSSASRCCGAPPPAPRECDLVPCSFVLAFLWQWRAQEGRGARCSDPGARACH